jgi:steroid delta-isomerase-like uncharacterized protein
MSSEAIQALVEQLATAWNDRDLESFTTCLTEDVIWDDPAMVTPAVGREAVRAFSDSVLRAFPDFKYVIRHPVCVAVDGSRCTVLWTITATSLGPLDPPGFGPTGRRVRFQGVDVLELEGGKVKRIDTFFDVLKPAEQLLAVQLRPSPGSWRQHFLVWTQRLRAAWLRGIGRDARGGQESAV